MKQSLLAAIFMLLAACNHVTPSDAREIAYQRLSTYKDGPSLKGEELRSALTVSVHDGGKFLVEVRDESRNLLWVVTVQRSGDSEIARMAIDG